MMNHEQSSIKKRQSSSVLIQSCIFFCPISKGKNNLMHVHGLLKNGKVSSCIKKQTLFSMKVIYLVQFHMPSVHEISYSIVLCVVFTGNFGSRKYVSSFLRVGGGGEGGGKVRYIKTEVWTLKI